MQYTSKNKAKPLSDIPPNAKPSKTINLKPGNYIATLLVAYLILGTYAYVHSGEGNEESTELIRR